MPLSRGSSSRASRRARPRPLNSASTWWCTFFAVEHRGMQGDPPLLASAGKLLGQLGVHRAEHAHRPRRVETKNGRPDRSSATRARVSSMGSRQLP